MEVERNINSVVENSLFINKANIIKGSDKMVELDNYKMKLNSYEGPLLEVGDSL